MGIIALVLAPVLLLVHFLCQENVLTCQCCLPYSLFGTCWWNILCHLRLVWHCCTPWDAELLEDCWDGLTASAESCSPRSPSHRHGSVPGILQPGILMPGPSVHYTWVTPGPGFSSCPFDAFRVTPWPKPGIAIVGFASSQIVWEGPCTSAISPAVFWSISTKAVCRQHNEFGGMSDIKPHLPSSSFTLLDLPGWWCPCPDNSWFPLQLSFSLPHFFDGSNFCQQIALSSPSHCKKEGHVCRVKKLWPTCRQVLRTCCGCAVTHISWEADVS